MKLSLRAALMAGALIASSGAALAEPVSLAAALAQGAEQSPRIAGSKAKADAAEARGHWGWWRQRSAEDADAGSGAAGRRRCAGVGGRMGGRCRRGAGICVPCGAFIIWDESQLAGNYRG